jgi:hypothetical protein
LSKFLLKKKKKKALTGEKGPEVEVFVNLLAEDQKSFFRLKQNLKYWNGKSSWKEISAINWCKFIVRYTFTSI